MKKDYVGERFGKLIALKREEKENGTYYYCKCDCGVKKWIRGDVLIKARSCGCIREEKRNKVNKNLINTYLDKYIKDGTNLAVIGRDKPIITNKSGFTGVHYDKNRDKWVAQIVIKGQHIFLGRFINKKDAVKSRKEAEEKYFKPIINKVEKN